MTQNPERFKDYQDSDTRNRCSNCIPSCIFQGKSDQSFERFPSWDRFDDSRALFKQVFVPCRTIINMILVSSFQVKVHIFSPVSIIDDRSDSFIFQIHIEKINQGSMILFPLYRNKSLYKRLKTMKNGCDKSLVQKCVV